MKPLLSFKNNYFFCFYTFNFIFVIKRVVSFEMTLCYTHLSFGKKSVSKTLNLCSMRSGCAKWSKLHFHCEFNIGIFEKSFHMKWLLFILLKNERQRKFEESENSPLPYMTANEPHGEMRVRQRGRSKGETLYKHIRRI